MIGNEIEFKHYDWSSHLMYSERDKGKKIGLVVDAFTNVSGSVSGKTEVFLGFGEGSTTGKTESKRMYKVEYYEEYDRDKKNPRYTDIYAWQLIKIIKMADSFKRQETNEEKFV